jgi:hypothetical protein
VIVRTVKLSDAIAVAELRLAWANERSDVVEPVESYAAGLAPWISAHRANLIGKIAQQPSGAAVGMGWLAVLDRLPVPTRHDRHSGDIQSVFVVPEYKYSSRAIHRQEVACGAECLRAACLSGATPTPMRYF